MRVQSTSLPHPQRERWQPLRSGFVNLYRYDQEEFHYENGRLLLRGNNGTGKSRVLALQLPFLLDGEVTPERLEPDADPSKRIEWNLLMDRYPERTGYSWIEFGRRELNGKEHYLTIGCGLSAAHGQPGVRRWFFVTSQRIGQNLELAGDSKQVFGKDQLTVKIGSAGRVFDSAAEYRSAVNDALFQLDEQRYSSLISLLIQLRRPQLTRRLEEQDLSRALSEALAPVSPALIANLAEAFQELESDRSQLNSSRFALAAVEQFLNGYRAYAEVAAKRRAERVLAAHDEYEIAIREILLAESECDRSLEELGRLKSELLRLDSEKQSLRSEIEVFERSTKSRDAQAVEQAHLLAIEARKQADTAAADVAEASRFRKSCVDEYFKLRNTADQRQLRLNAAADAAAAAAVAAGMESAHRRCFAECDLNAADSAYLERLKENIADAVHTHSAGIEKIETLSENVSTFRSELRRACADRDLLSGLLDDAREQWNAALAEHQSAVTTFLGAASNWTSGLTELPLPFDESFLRSVSDWCNRPHGPNPFAAASRHSVEELTLNFSETRACLKQIEQIQTAELNQLEIELERLNSGAKVNESQRRQVLELQSEIAEIQGKLDPIIDSIQDLNRRESILRSEALATPSDESVRKIYEYSIALSRHVDSLRDRVQSVEDFVQQKQQQCDRIVESFNRTASELGLADWIHDLKALHEGILNYRLSLASLWPVVESCRDAQTASDTARHAVDYATVRDFRQKEIASLLEQRAAAAEIELGAAGQASDSGFVGVLERTSRAKERLASLGQEEKDLQRRHHDTEIAVTRLDERLRSRTVILTGETDRRDSAASALRLFASTGLLMLTAPGIDGKNARGWSTARTVEVAYELVSRLSSIDAGDSAWEYQQRSAPSQFNALMQALSIQGYKSSATFRDDVFVAAVAFAGQDRTINEVRQILSDDVSDRQLLLDSRAREILEDHLSGAVATHLGELLHVAEEQVRWMNIELDSRPMSTGMKLRFVWRFAETAPAGMNEARQRLMQLNAAWRPSDRQMLGKFLQQRIEAACSDIEGAGWHDSLTEALDYRKWHSFGIERFHDGVWLRLTPKTFGTGSGGEKAVALTLPHFAAAAAFYRTAQPLAPRLILLDEAFVGIDSDMRAKCMGLIDVFDLDFMMTSEREWGCYSTLPGIAIYQLSTRPGIDAIGLTRWVWNGRQRRLMRHSGTEETGKSDPGNTALGATAGLPRTSRMPSRKHDPKPG